MSPFVRMPALILIALLMLGACASGPSGGTTAASSSAPAMAPSVAAGGSAAPPAQAAAGEPCSWLTAEQVGAIVGTVPVEVAERVGRGDCDYWLSAAKDSKVNIGLFTGADATAYFETTKAIGTPQAMSIGDDAYSIFNESFGTVVVVRKGDAVVAAQVFAGAATDQVRQATALVEAILARL